jgi:hypothetical protein
MQRPNHFHEPERNSNAIVYRQNTASINGELTQVVQLPIRITANTNNYSLFNHCKTECHV